MSRLIATCLLAALLAAAAPAQERRRSQAPESAPAPQAAAPAKEEPRRDPPKEQTSQTQHSVRIAGQEIKYTATAGTLVLKKEDGTARASVFYIAYVRDGLADAATRPITFAFNGGPGSSSVWLHLGTLGPKRVLLDDQGYPPPPPGKLVDNEYSILDLSDIVFIDPVSTGYSRAVSEAEAKQFHGMREDVEAVADFVRLYTTRNKRWASPKYLAGESYGTTRASALSGYLQDRLGMNLNGIMLISSILNFQTARFAPGNDLPYILFMPTYTASAWYHKKLSKDLQGNLRKTLDEAERFANGEYATALMKGDALTRDEREQVKKKLARYTGLPERYIEETNLRISISRFTKELLRSEGRSVGRYDSRYTGIDRDGAGESPDFDPSYAAVQGSYTAAFNEYVRTALKFESDLPYEVLTSRVQPWSYRDYENRYVNVAETLREAMTKNPFLRVFVAKGYYDLATPYFAAEYTFNHMGLAEPLRKNVTQAAYEAGHMMYLQKASLVKLREDLARFLR